MKKHIMWKRSLLLLLLLGMVISFIPPTVVAGDTPLAQITPTVVQEGVKTTVPVNVMTSSRVMLWSFTPSATGVYTISTNLAHTVQNEKGGQNLFNAKDPQTNLELTFTDYSWLDESLSSQCVKLEQGKTYEFWTEGNLPESADVLVEKAKWKVESSDIPVVLSLFSKKRIPIALPGSPLRGSARWQIQITEGNGVVTVDSTDADGGGPVFTFNVSAASAGNAKVRIVADIPDESAFYIYNVDIQVIPYRVNVKFPETIKVGESRTPGATVEAISGSSESPEYKDVTDQFEITYNVDGSVMEGETSLPLLGIDTKTNKITGMNEGPALVVATATKKDDNKVSVEGNSWTRVSAGELKPTVQDAGNDSVTARITGTYDATNPDKNVEVAEKTVTINASADGMAGVKSATVEVAPDAAKSIQTAGIETLTIKTNVADVTFGKSAIKKVAESGRSYLQISREDKTEGVCTLDISMKHEQEDILPASQSQTNGEITVTIPYERADGKAVKVVYVSDSSEESVPATYDSQTKRLSFVTTHFSQFRIYQTEEVAPQPNKYKEPDCDGKDCILEKNFKDITDVTKEWWHTDVEFMYLNGLMKGDNLGQMNTGSKITRAEFIQILYNISDRPKTSGTTSFSDVKTGDWWYDAVLWAEKNGITNGNGLGQFEPKAEISREQVAAFLHRYADSPKGSGDLSKFKDGSKVDSWATDAMKWAVEKKIMEGNERGELRPTQGAYRCEVAKMVHVFLKLQ